MEVHSTSNISFFLSENKIFLPEGRQCDSSVSLISRIESRLESKIAECVLNADEKGRVVEHTFFFIIKDNVFQIVDVEHFYTGYGELFGDAWNWTGWNYKLKNCDGSGTIDAETKVHEEGLNSSKKLYASDGTIRLLFEEDAIKINKESFEILYLKLLDKQ